MYLTVYSVSQLSSSSKRAKLASLLKRIRKESLLQSAAPLRGTVSSRQTVSLREAVLSRKTALSEETVSSRGTRSEAVSRLSKS